MRAEAAAPPRAQAFGDGAASGSPGAPAAPKDRAAGRKAKAKARFTLLRSNRQANRARPENPGSADARPGPPGNARPAPGGGATPRRGDGGPLTRPRETRPQHLRGTEPSAEPLQVAKARSDKAGPAVLRPTRLPGSKCLQGTDGRCHHRRPRGTLADPRALVERRADPEATAPTTKKGADSRRAGRTEAKEPLEPTAAERGSRELAALSR